MRKLLLLLLLLPMLASAQTIFSYQNWADGGNLMSRINIPHDSTMQGSKSPKSDLLFIAGQVWGLGVDGHYHNLTGASAPLTTIAWDSVTGTPTTLNGYGITDGVTNVGSYLDPSWIIGLSGLKVTGFFADSNTVGFHTPGYYWALFGGGGSGTVHVTAPLQGDGSVGGPLNMLGWTSPGALKFYGYDASGTLGLQTLGTAAFIDKPASGNATGGQAVIATDSRLADSRTPAGTNVVPNTMLAQMPTNTIKGNNTGSTANAADLTVSQVNALIGNDTSRATIGGLLAQKQTNFGGAPGQLQGTFAGIPAATGFATGTTYIAQDSGFQYVDTGSGGSRGWKLMARGSGGGGSGPALSNPTATIGYSIINGTAATAMRSDAAPKIDTTPTAGVAPYHDLIDTARVLRQAIAANFVSPAASNKQVQINNSGAFGTVPNFTADPATNLVNADSITSHKFRGDSLKLNLAVQANRGFGGATKYFAVGNSITFGLNSSVFDSSYVACNGRLFQLPVVDSGVSSTLTPGIASMHLRNINYPNTFVSSIMGGFNNARNTNVLNNRPTMNNIVYSYKAVCWNQFAGPVQNATSGTGVTRTGSWTTGYNGIINAGGKTTGVSYTSSAGAYIEYAFTDSTVGALCYTPTNGPTSVTVSIDGSVVQTLSTAGKFDGLGAYLSVSYGMFPIIVTGLSNAAHTLRITNVSGGLFLVDCFTSFVSSASANSMALIFYHVPKQNAAGYAGNPNYSDAAADTINSKIDSLAAALPSAWPIYVAKTNVRYNVTTGLSGDNIHPNNTGHKQISLAAADAVNGVPPAPGVIFAQYNPDGSFAGFVAKSEKTGQKNKLAFTTSNGLQDIIINNPTMGTDNVIDGANYKLSFINFLRMIFDSTKITQGIIVQNGAISVVGPSATIRVVNRGADTTQKGYEWYVSGNKMAFYDEFSNRNILAADTSLRVGFFVDPSETSFGSSAMTAGVHIGANRTGRQGHAPLKANFGALMPTPEQGAFEPDSLSGGLLWTRRNGIRVRIDSPTVASSSAPFSDATAIAKNSADATKLFKFDLSGITTGTTITETIPNYSFTPASLGHAQTFTGNNTFTAGLFYVNSGDIQLNSGSTGSLFVSPVDVSVNGGVNYSSLSFTASFTISTISTSYSGAFLTCGTLSTAGVITLPSTGAGGRTYKLVNSNNTANAWTFAGATLKDAFGNTITSFPNGYTYEIYFNGTTWDIKTITGNKGIPIAGSFSAVGTATTTFTVTTGITEPNTAYKVNVTPTDLLGAALFYVTNKTTTTFDVVYLSGLTGTVSFDWTITP